METQVRPNFTNWLSEYRTFFAAARSNPRAIGAITPTTPAVGALIAQVVPSVGAPVVLELGPGTGTVSDGVHHRLSEASRHIGIELRDDLVEYLRAHKPWLEVVHGDAIHLLSLLDDLGVHQVDAVISTIPWTVLPRNVQEHILRQVINILAPDGVFTAVTYIPSLRAAGKRQFRRLLAASFDEVLTPVTLACFPPIQHYLCRRPRTLYRYAEPVPPSNDGSE